MTAAFTPAAHSEPWYRNDPSIFQGTESNPFRHELDNAMIPLAAKQVCNLATDSEVAFLRELYAGYGCFDQSLMVQRAEEHLKETDRAVILDANGCEREPDLEAAPWSDYCRVAAEMSVLVFAQNEGRDADDLPERARAEADRQTQLLRKLFFYQAALYPDGEPTC